MLEFVRPYMYFRGVSATLAYQNHRGARRARARPRTEAGPATAGSAFGVSGRRSHRAEHDLDEEFSTRHGTVSLRWVLTHLIQELARHAGHGDMLVEQLVARRPG